MKNKMLKFINILFACIAGILGVFLFFQTMYFEWEYARKSFLAYLDPTVHWRAILKLFTDVWIYLEIACLVIVFKTGGLDRDK